MTVFGFRQSLRQFMASKTNWTGLSAIVVALVGYLSDAYTPVQATEQIMLGLGLLAVRDAIAGVGQ